MQTVNYIIIGAGISGLCLHHYLNDKDCLIFDDNCGAYKIGESIIPRFFNHPDMAEVLAKARLLPSCSPKIGTLIINDNVVASYPLGDKACEQAMHVGRMDLDNLLKEHWLVPVISQRVTDVDLKNKIVYTKNASYRFRKQLIDCSGSKHFLSKNQNTEHELWPVRALWRYYKIDSIDNERFWQKLQSSGKVYKRFELGEGVSMPAHEENRAYPSQVTTLMRLEQGVWLWQIPLYQEKILSVGIVSKNKKIDKEEFSRYVEKFHIENFSISPLVRTSSDPYGRFHAKINFARHAQVASGEDFILAGDSFSFADPVYSVGTAMAIRQAREIALLLNDGGWNKKKSDHYNVMMNKVFEHTVKAFEFWYNEEVITNTQVAQKIQQEVLHGDLFELGFREVYENVLENAQIEIAVGNFRNHFYLNQKIEGYKLTQILYRMKRVELTFFKNEFFTVLLDAPENIIESPGGQKPYFLKTDNFFISYSGESLNDAQHSLLKTIAELL